MRPVPTARALLLTLSFAVVLAACGDGGEESPDTSAADAEAGAAMAARLMNVGEPLGTIVESRAAGIVPGLQVALNPTLVASVSSTIEIGGERLDSFAELAGMTAEEFAALWDSDRNDAFARFAAGLEATEDPLAAADDLLIDLPAALPVHPEGRLLGSVVTRRVTGDLAFFVVYDTPGPQIDAEGVVVGQVDQSPWQVTGGRSNRDLGFVQFQNTISPDVSGFAWILPRTTPDPDPVAAEDGGTDGDAAGAAEGAAAAGSGPASTVVYLIQAQPPIPSFEQPFELPEYGRPVPDRFPATFLLEGDQTVVELFWNSQPGVSGYQLVVLTPGSSFEATELYRERIEAQGWEITSDDAVGFATVLEFASEDRSLQGSVSFDTFAEDDTYTQITLQVQSAGSSPS